ncbi:Ger(x)C family spore germination protein [Paenibacillus sp. MMS20-IR301]|uniref:Ger(x)C family spore germination protein n=1 Tax=Paenibacillus sp. MMS20-IR301 TaxID=2895946 RepID=UPI0028E4687B|nr:Ger(x)C family spore germination protein [Paenibacillus sp. MMS20-IR301]WNS45763.1 Ger(x)C family spore germination protein [Paenibacillus sp. MMS20-IR301]
MNNKPFKLSGILLALVQLLLLTGCWDSVELNRRAIVSGVAIDRGETEAEKFRLSFQVIVAEEISGENTRGISPVALYTGTGRTMFEALANASRQTARFLSLGHVRVLVISEEFAREGIKDILDVLERESDTRLTSLIFISRGQPALTLMSTMTVFSKIPANDLVEKLETSSKQFGYNFRMEVDDVIRGIQLRGGGPIINGVFTSGSRKQADTNDNLKSIEPKSILRISGFAAFKDDKMKGWLDGDAALGTVLLHNKTKQFPVLIKHSEGGYIAFNVYQSQVSLKVESADPEHPVITIRIRQQAAVKESPNSLDLTSPEVLEDLSEQLTGETVKQIRLAVTTAREFNSDYLGFGQAMQRSNPRGWKQIKNHWEEVFARCELKFEADAVIRHTDMRSNSFQIN